MNTESERSDYNDIEEHSRIVVEFIRKKGLITACEIYEETGIPINRIIEILTILSCTPLVKKIEVTGQYIWSGIDIQELKKVKEEIEKERKRLEKLHQITHPSNN